jgi:hypothetical protein
MNDGSYMDGTFIGGIVKMNDEIDFEDSGPIFKTDDNTKI